MAKPPTSAKSVRLTDEAWAALKIAAVREKTTPNALIANAVKFYLSVTRPVSPTMMVGDEVFAEIKRAASTTAYWPSGALVEPHHTEDPVPKLTLGSAVTFGPRRAVAGSRLKVKK